MLIRKLIAVAIGIVIGVALEGAALLGIALASGWQTLPPIQDPSGPASGDAFWALLALPFLIGFGIWLAWPRKRSLRETLRDIFE